jgi:hypothetical protein
LTSGKEVRLTNDRTTELAEDVERAARVVARRWPDVIDEDDAYQEIWLRLLENDYVDRVYELDAAARGDVLRRIGVQIASQYRDDYEIFSGQVCYGTDEVYRLLSAQITLADLDPSSETLAEYIDLHEASQLLRDSIPRYAEVIGARFVFGQPVSDSKLVTRAVSALTREMNRAYLRRSAAHAPGASFRTRRHEPPR